MSERSDVDLPLAGVRVLDLSTSYAGPTAGMYLADLGADVIKVERPGRGDDARAWGPPFVDGVSAWFASANRGKQSIALDLREPAGQSVLHRLLERTDVLLQNNNPVKLAALGLDPADLRERYPRLIHCAISGFGLDGPDAGLPGYDLVAQARSGLMSVTGDHNSPQRVSTALSDIVSAMCACVAVCAALRRQALTGQGDTVDISLLDSDLALMAPRIASYLAGEPEPQPCAGTDSVLSVYRQFATADDAIVLAVGNDNLWQRCCAALGLDLLAADQRLSTNAGRRAHRAEVLDAVQEKLLHHGAEHWLAVLAAAGVPAAPVQFLSRVVTDRQVQARGSIVDATVAGTSTTLKAVRTPWRLASSLTTNTGTVPLLGADTTAVLTDLGLTEEESEALAQTGAFGPVTRSGALA